MIYTVAAVLCVLAQSGLRAQTLSDPMRPPDASGTLAPGAAASSVSGLQGAITSPGRKLAVIDGSVVPLGASVRGSTLDNVSESVAVLKKNGERNVLLMHPQIEKKPARRSEIR
jgi:MSHA biogenesis protein MshK